MDRYELMVMPVDQLCTGQWL